MFHLFLCLFTIALFSNPLVASSIEFKDPMEHKLTSFNGTGCDFYNGKAGEEDRAFDRVFAEVAQHKDSSFDLRVKILAKGGASNRVLKAQFSKDRENPDTDTLIVKHCEIGVRLESVDGKPFRLYDVAPAVSLSYRLKRFGTGSKSRFVTSYLSFALKTLAGQKSTMQFNPKEDDGDPTTVTEVLTPAFKTGCASSLDLVMSLRLAMRGLPGDEDTALYVDKFPRFIHGKVAPC